MSPATGDGDGHPVTRYFRAFFLWRLSLLVCLASSESQSSSGLNSASVTEQRDCGPFSTDVLATLTLFLLVLLNPAASRAVRHTPGVPALTSRAGASLSFVFLMPPASSRAHVRTYTRSRNSWSQSAVLRVSPASARSPCRWLPLLGARKWPLPPPSVYLPISVRGFTVPRFVPLYSALEMFICRDPDVSSCVSG